ncbi:MAG: hypothetical protein K8L97_12180 [Anaerolineae bacterium]|nr:hypothetical protein [Anaerolineae bacterium]
MLRIYVVLILYLMGLWVAGNDVRLLVMHTARLTIEIPARWIITDNMGFPAYEDETGYVFAFPQIFEDGTLMERCAEFSEELGYFGSNPAIIEMVIDDQPACKIMPSDDQPESFRGFPTRGGIGLLIEHPTPFDFYGQTVDTVGVIVDAEHFEAISATIDFDPEKVTGNGYLEGVLDYLERYSYYGSELDWEAIRADILARKVSLRNIPSTMRELIGKLQRVGDRHSFYWDAQTVQTFLVGSPDAAENPPQLPRGERLENGIGYVELFTTLGIGGVEGEKQYVAAAHAAIEAIDATPTRCWIVDLRQDSGGSMDPMIIGIAPILGNGAIGGFELPNGEQQILTLQDGVILQDGFARSSLYGETVYEPHYPEPPIAVLIGNMTASAGENTTLALIGRANTRTFGTPTAGLTVGNSGMMLYDGAALGVAGAASMDRTGRAYTGAIEPDVVVRTTGLPDGNDAVMQAASDWLLSLPECEAS